MLNFGAEDSITGWNIKGIWTQDQNIKSIFRSLTEHSK